MMNKVVKKAVILAGGKGTRLAEETVSRPKPMVEIGGKPILWHIMKYYSENGINEFIICLGHKGYAIKEYFLNYSLHQSDITVDIKENGRSEYLIHKSMAENWKITLAETGEDTMTGGRIKRIKDYLNDDEHFCMTYGDGLSNINIQDLIRFHFDQKKQATVSGVKPLARFGALEIDGNLVTSFKEKPETEGGYINGGFFVISKDVLDLLKNDETIFEKDPLEQLAQNGNLSVYKHDGFWQPMDTLRDKMFLESLWNDNKAPWKVW